tara:strand:+ start:374 stop:523 length:150 start_codon:yes stop_codon:yes gene_type:complete
MNPREKGFTVGDLLLTVGIFLVAVLLWNGINAYKSDSNQTYLLERTNFG